MAPQNNHAKFMRMALREAKKSKQPRGSGAVIVHKGKIIARAHNKQRETNNPSAHAEILAMAQAGKKLGKKHLHNCTLYSTSEPCTMCMSAIIFAEIPKLYYAVPATEAYPDNIPISITLEQLLSYTEHEIEIIHKFMREEVLSLIRQSGE